MTSCRRFLIVPRSGTPQFFTLHFSLFSQKKLSAAFAADSFFYFTYSHTASASCASRIRGMPHTKYQCFVL